MHLSGAVPVLDLQSLMENDTDGIAFVIIRTVECSEASVLLASAGGPLWWTEAVYAKSRILKESLQTIATCHFQPVSSEEMPTTMAYNDAGKMSGQDTKSPSKRNEIDPADLFLPSSGSVTTICFRAFRDCTARCCAA